MNVKNAVLDEMKQRLQECENHEVLERRGLLNVRQVLNMVGGPLPNGQLERFLTEADAMLLLAEYFLEWSELRQAFISGERQETAPKCLFVF